MKDADKQFDSEGRLVRDFSLSTGTLTEYEYGPDWRRITVTNNRNRSNHTTVIEQNRTDDGRFIDVVKTEEGDVYTIRTTYDESGREIRYERINKVKKTNLIKTFHHPKEGESCVYVINYNGNREIGFRADIKRLKPRS